MLDFLAPQPGESVLDLYAGVGLFARFLADAVGDRPAWSRSRATARAVRARRGEPARRRRSCARSTSAAVARGARRLAPVDLVVLDPPREGASVPSSSRSSTGAPRAVAYVACDPAALARDVAIFAEHGYVLERLRAFDLFPMTHHVECVALLVPAS